MRNGLDDSPSKPRTTKALGRARRTVGQKDTIGFAIVRVWAALARLLAPLFALLGERQAQAAYQVGVSRRTRISDRNQGETND